MKTYSSLVASDLTRELAAAGFLAIDAQDSAITQPAPPGLLICQVGGITESCASDPDRGYGSVYCLSLHIAVDLPKLVIWEWKLDLPWEDPQFQLLPDPAGTEFPDNMYEVPGCPHLKFPRDVVINHRRVLQRGHGLDGRLLGFGWESIPDSYHLGANIDASLVLIDEMGRGFSTPVQLWADRMVKLDRKRRKKNATRRLFEN